MDERCKVVDCNETGGWELAIKTPLGEIWALLCRDHRIQARELHRGASASISTSGFSLDGDA